MPAIVLVMGKKEGCNKMSKKLILLHPPNFMESHHIIKLLPIPLIFVYQFFHLNSRALILI